MSREVETMTRDIMGNEYVTENGRGEDEKVMRKRTMGVRGVENKKNEKSKENKIWEKEKKKKGTTILCSLTG
jgi:hypothetical protein